MDCITGDLFDIQNTLKTSSFYNWIEAAHRGTAPEHTYNSCFLYGGSIGRYARYAPRATNLSPYVRFFEPIQHDGRMIFMSRYFESQISIREVLLDGLYNGTD